MIKLIGSLLLLFLTNSALEARNNTCGSAELISQLNNISTSKEHTINTGSLSLFDLDDYFKFKPDVNGRLSFDYTSTANTSLFISTKNCVLGGVGVLGGSKLTLGKKASGFIDVKRGETVYVRMLGGGLGNTNYTLKLSFNVDGFYEDYNRNINGDIKIIGNSVLQKEKSEQKCGWKGIIYSCETIKTAECPGNNENNAQITTTFANIDNQAKNSTSAYLDLPANADSIQATLYWQGYFPSAGGGFNEANSKKIKFKPAGSSSYINLVSDNRYKKIYTEGWAYQGAVDVSKYVKQSGNYFVADLETKTGKYSGTGTFGAWALVVSYIDEDASYKNITVYDGFQVVENKTGYKDRKYKLEGFRTPRKGAVESTFMFFAGEGDVDISGDQVLLSKSDGTNVNVSDSKNPQNNIMNATITRNGSYVTSRNPSCQNNLGIDIDSFSVGTTGIGVIGTDQKETTVTLTTTQDKYFPGVFAFATELYKPDLCYVDQKVFLIDDKNSSKEYELASGATVELNSTIRIEAVIKNQSLDEDAYRVRLSHAFKDTSPYRQNSLKIGGVPKTDQSGDDFAKYEPSIDSVYFSLGSGAISDEEGGVLAFNGGTSETISFARDLNESDKLRLEYKIDFSNGTDEPAESNRIFACSGDPAFVINIGYNNPVQIYDDYSSNTNRDLYTKVLGTTGHSYKIATSAVGYSDNPDLWIYKIPLTVSEAPDWTNAANVHKTKLKNPTGFTATMPSKASKELKFVYRIGEGKDDIGEVVPVEEKRTFESFALRPMKFEIDESKVQGVIGEKSLLIRSIKAVDATGVNADGYGTTIVFKDSVGTTLDSSCRVKDLDKLIVDYTSTILAKNSVSFTNGVGSFTQGSVQFDDIGDFNLTITDKEWTSNDYGRESGKVDRCVSGESFSTPDGDGKVGCNIQGSIEVLMVPKKLTFDFTADKPFAYMSDQPNITNADEALLNPRDFLDYMHVTGLIKGIKNTGEITQNLHTGCFATDIKADLNISWSGQSVFVGDPINIEEQDRNISSKWRNIDDNLGLFVGGEAEFAIYANVDRGSHNREKNPVKLDMNVSLIIDQDWLKMLDDNGTNIDQVKPEYVVVKDHSFYYGRIYAPSRVTSYDNNATIGYLAEIYCPAGDCMGKQKSPTLTNWLIADHDSYTSLATQLEDKAGETVKFQDGNASLSVDQAGLYHHDIPSYLWYGRFVKEYAFEAPFNKQSCAYHPCTDVELKGKGDQWGGTGSIGEDKDKRRIEADDKTEAKQDTKPRINW